MKKQLLIVFLGLMIATSLMAQTGEMEVKIGYVITDEEDNQAVNQETFNTYEGPAFSLNNIYVGFENGLKFTGDMSNLSLNNRNMNMTLSKAGLTQINFYNNQYRRVYSADGSNFTRREATGLNGFVKPHKNLKLFGGFDYFDKDGTAQYSLDPVGESNEYEINYTQYSYNFGGQAYCPYGNMRYEFKQITFQNDINFDLDRTADVHNLSFYSSLPSYRWFTLAAGYYNRSDEYDSTSLKLATESFWGGGKIYLKNQWLIDFRTILATTEHNDDLNEQDNKYYTVAVGKTFKRMAGFRVGYELRNAENDTRKTTADGYMISGWYNYLGKLYLKGRYSFISSTVDEGDILIGETERSRHMISAKYQDTQWGSLSAKLEKRIKKYDDIDTEVDYTSASGALALKTKFGKFVASYKYNFGEYYNRSEDLGFEFSDHIVCGGLYPIAYHGLDLYVGATYYTTFRDLEMEKLSLDAKIGWEFIPMHRIEGRYQMYTYDDFFVINDTYTANNFEINFIKELKF